MITLLLMLLATAAEPTGAAAALAGDAPGLAGDGLQTAVFSSRGVVTDDTDTSRAGAATVHFGWAHLPFVLHGATDRVAVVRDDGVASVSGGVDFGPMRFAVAFPAYLATSDRFEGIRTAPGDASVEAHFVPFSAGGKHPGLGLIVHASFPLGAARLGLGGAGATWEGRVLLDGTAGPVWIAAEAGVRTVPTVTVGDVSVDTSFVFRQATGVRFSPHGGMTLEWFGAVGVLEPYAPESTPIEALLSGWIDVDHGLSIRLGAGTAVVRGWSAPPIRLLAEIHGEFPRVQRAKR